MSSRKRPASSTQNDLFDAEVSLLLPPRFAVDGKVLGSPVRQLACPALRASCRLRTFSIRRVNGYETTLKSGETLKIISTKSATQLKADLEHQIGLKLSGALDAEDHQHQERHSA